MFSIYTDRYFPLQYGCKFHLFQFIFAQIKFTFFANLDCIFDILNDININFKSWSFFFFFFFKWHNCFWHHTAKTVIENQHVLEQGSLCLLLQFCALCLWNNFWAKELSSLCLYCLTYSFKYWIMIWFALFWWNSFSAALEGSFEVSVCFHVHSLQEIVFSITQGYHLAFINLILV